MLVIARHGRTQANASALLQGRADHPLDEQGKKQAAGIASAVRQLPGGLEAVEQVVCSPLLRARQTAEAIGMPVVETDGWLELSYGEWENKPIADVSAEMWATWRSDASFTPPGGESLLTLTQRVWRACEALVDVAADDRHVVVVTHVSPIKAAVAWALGVETIEQAVAMSWRMHVAQAQISTIQFRNGRPLLASYNSTAHLTGT